MSDAPVYQINTIEDLFNIATEENVARLCVDIYVALQQHIILKKEVPSAVLKEFTWIDDGVHTSEAHVSASNAKFVLKSAIQRVDESS